MDKGWIKLHRKVQEHWIWQEKPFDKKSAWIDLILSANHKDNKFLLGNELVEVKRGSFITSEYKLMNRWGWSKTKVRSFLELLQNENMVIKVSDRKKTTLTIVNYNDYQVPETTEKPIKNYEETTKEPHKNPNKNDKNVKNDKEDIYILTEDEKHFLEILNQIENYPLDRKKDLEMFKTLAERYPELNLLEAIEQWRMYKLDKPLKANSNPRSQINTAFKKYIEWGKCIKKGGANDGKHRANNQGASEETLRLEKIAKEQGLIGADGTIEEPEQVDF